MAKIIEILSRPLIAAGLMASLLTIPALAQGRGDMNDGESDAAESEEGHVFGVELKANFRDSDEARFPSPFPFGPDARPVGQDSAFMETVDAGEHFEVSTATVFYRGQWGEHWGAKAKVDLIDRHDRNPTSEDREWDIDELWLRYGPEVEPGDFYEGGFSGYAKVGKFAKFERQDDRHLESYGLLSTAFNRMEDIGVESGFDLGSTFYLKLSVTQGNPVFIRDPNALAGDNGTTIFNGSTTNPLSDLKSGIPILYDADIDHVDFDNPEAGIGLGLRFGDGYGWALDVLGFYYTRELAETVELDDTFYGGDLDVLLGPFNQFSLGPITSRDKDEYGLNLWLYAGGLSVFGQYVEQDLGGLEREGYEVEVAYDLELPYFGALFGRQILPYIAPAVRYSEIDHSFGNADRRFPFPSPSVFWDWQKLDLGVRLGLLQGMVDMTVEFNDNEFIRGGQKESADEFLATFRFMWDSFSR